MIGRLATAALVVLVALPASSAVMLATSAPAGCTEPSWDRVQRERRVLELPRLSRSDTLDGVAQRQAEYIAGRPARRRMADSLPLGSLLEDANIRYKEVFRHLDLKRGYADLPVAFARGWAAHADSWAYLADPDVDAVGLGCATAADGWTVFVAVLVDLRRVQWDVKKLERRTHAQINAVRERHGLRPLERHAALAKVARRHSRDMLDRGFFDHVSPGGDRPVDRVVSAGVRYRLVAENIQLNNDPEDPVLTAVEAWMQSRGHRENILEPRYTHSGIGVAVDDDGTVSFTQLFLLPR